MTNSDDEEGWSEDDVEQAVARIGPDADTAPYRLAEHEMEALRRMSIPRRRAHTVPIDRESTG